MAVVISIEGTDESFVAPSEQAVDIMNWYNMHTQATDIFKEFTVNGEEDFWGRPMDEVLSELSTYSDTPEGPSYVSTSQPSPVENSSGGNNASTYSEPTALGTLMSDDIVNGKYNSIPGMVVGGFMSAIKGPSEQQQDLANAIDDRSKEKQSRSFEQQLEDTANLKGRRENNRAGKHTAMGVVGGFLTGGPVGALVGLGKSLIGISTQNDVNRMIDKSLAKDEWKETISADYDPSTYREYNGLDFSTSATDQGTSYSTAGSAGSSDFSGFESGNIADSNFGHSDDLGDVGFNGYSGEGSGNSSGGGATDGFEGSSDDHL